MADHFSDLLLAAIASKGSPVCVGLDPVAERLPAALRPANPDDGSAALDAICEFSATVIDAVSEHVPAIKIQSACFERYRGDGVEALYELIGEARDRGLFVILDAKRGDIGISADHYAAATFDPPRMDPDCLADRVAVPHAITINGYLGADGIMPFCRRTQGAFVLVRTSNPGGDELQRMMLASGHTVAEQAAIMVDRLGADCRGECGYSDLGAVVGATKREEIANLRQLMPHSLFLVPGYGAQGGTAEDVRASFNRDGTGAIITASRSVIYAFDENDADWSGAIEQAAIRFAAEVRGIIS